jgi:hypothetical protein
VIKEASGGRIPASEPRDERRFVYAVYAVRADEVTATELVCGQLAGAEEYAASLSTDPGVLAAAVTRYLVDAPGERKPLVLFVAGKRQQVPYVSDDRRVFANWRRHG